MTKYVCKSCGKVVDAPMCCGEKMEEQEEGEGSEEAKESSEETGGCCQ